MNEQISRWLAELAEFVEMTRAAKKGLKVSCGGRLDPEDADAYEAEEVGCEAAMRVLGGLEGGPADQVEPALQALRAANIPRPAVDWACAVVQGDARRFWNAYHPRRRP